MSDELTPARLQYMALVLQEYHGWQVYRSVVDLMAGGESIAGNEKADQVLVPAGGANNMDRHLGRKRK